MSVDAEVPGQRSNVQMPRIKVEKHAMLEQRQQVLAYGAAEVQQQVSTSNYSPDLGAASSECRAVFRLAENQGES